VSDERELIRSRVSIVDLISSEIKLKKSGRNWTGLCPFHEDKNPSFSVSELTGSYRCWSCGAKGDVFTWVMERQRMSFREALEFLAARAGIELAKLQQEGPSKRQTYVQLMEAAQAFFQESLEASAEAKAYLRERRIDSETVAAWGIGYAPIQPDILPTILKRKGFSLADAQEVFLVDGDPQAGYGAKFRDRIMFPIHDERGTLVAFGGRLLGQGKAKYINSSDTPLYRKSRVLYGLSKAKEAIQVEDRSVLVEGYLDVIACHRAGVQTAVASLGTSLTEDQAKLLRRWCKSVTVLYDSDEAGQKAAEKAAEIFRPEGFEVQVSLMPPGQDPDSLLRNVGPTPILQAVEKGLRPLDFRIAQIEAKLQPSESEFWDQVVEALLAEKDALQQAKWIERLAPKHPELRDPVLARQALMRQLRAKSAPVAASAETKRRKRERFGSVDLRGPERVVFSALADELLRPLAWSGLQVIGGFRSAAALGWRTMLLGCLKECPEGPIAEWTGRLEPVEVRYDFLDFLMNAPHQPSREDVEGAIASLKSDAERGEIRRLALIEGDLDDDQLAEINARIRRLKGVE